MRKVHNARLVVIAIIAVVSFSSLSVRKASALELYNNDALLTRLKKNQVVSEKDIVEVKNSYPKVELMGSLQLRYVNGLDTASPDSVSDLYINRLNLRVVAHLTEKTSFVIQPEYGRGESLIKDAYLRYSQSGLDIFAGNHRVPFGADALKNDINLTFVDRNLASRISPDYLPGASVGTTLLGSKLMAQVGMWNGNINSKAEAKLINNSLADAQIFSSTAGASGSNIIIEALRLAYSSKGHSTFYPGGRSFDDDENFSKSMSYGGGFSYYNSAAIHDKASTVSLVGLNGASAYEIDLFFKMWRLSTEFEYAKRTLDWWQYSAATTSNSLVSSTQTSVAIQASAIVIDNLSLSTRYETFTYDGKGSVLKGMYGQDKDNWFTLGINYYFKEQHTKVQANYINKAEVMPDGVTAPSTSNALYLQATMYF